MVVVGLLLLLLFGAAMAFTKKPAFRSAGEQARMCIDGWCDVWEQQEQGRGDGRWAALLASPRNEPHNETRQQMVLLP
jgi:hypothetical protein